MQSSELARLAGVTVRSLRHWHQIGVLPEPARSANGYRDYDAVDFVRVLRIRRLASLGMPLERMGAVLDRGENSTRILDDLDSELSAQIDRLTRQRELIARMRDAGASPDVPPELAPVVSAFVAAGLSPEMARFDRDQAVLLAHLAGEEGLPQLVRFYERLAGPGRARAAADLMNRFGAIDDATDAAVVDAIVDELVDVCLDLFDEIDDPGIGNRLSGAAHVVSEYADESLNPRQRAVLDRVENRLAGS
ncbi:MAG: hypothetical protein K0R99_1945 [Microbacterium sp.]|uniref:MerR family transcriptional regulator n=1 Tax=Microbacterium sp. TaxID=51671 RepID=UPI002609C611|nr:MerR family transcriptional regulator [Microbacterium sp.]MDF2560499.1 hypothetical protein [Microbacterium sp.]